MANTVVQLRRSSVAGRQPNTTSSANSQYINAGELGLNMTDRLLYTSDGTNLFIIGANTPSQRVGNSSVVGFSANSSNIVIGSTTTVTANGLNGTAGQALLSNGSATYWGNPTAVSGPAGSNAQVQFNNSGSTAGAAGLLFDYTQNNLTVANTLTVGGATTFNGPTTFANGFPGQIYAVAAGYALL